MLLVRESIITHNNITRGFRLTVNLVTENKETKSPDFNNIACQVRLDFIEKSVKIHSKVGGENRLTKDEETNPEDLFSGKCYMNITSHRLLSLVTCFQCKSRLSRYHHYRNGKIYHLSTGELSLKDKSFDLVYAPAFHIVPCLVIFWVTYHK